MRRVVARFNFSCNLIGNRPQSLNGLTANVSTNYKNPTNVTSHKPLKSVSHNFGHSFISLMNYINDDYFLGHLLRQMRITNLPRLEVNILENTANPKDLLTKPIIDSIKHWNTWFPTLVKNSGSTMDYVTKATMTIEFDLNKSRLYNNDNRVTENPFTCKIAIIDDRDREYKHTHEGWWYPET